jgi:hypothetical protein
MDVNDRWAGQAPRVPRAHASPAEPAAESEPVPSDTERAGRTNGRSLRSPLPAPTSGHRGDGADLHRFVLRYRGDGQAPADDVARIEGEVSLLDRTARMVLVEASGRQVADLIAALPRWAAAEERMFRLAGSRRVSLVRPESEGSAR